MDSENLNWIETEIERASQRLLGMASGRSDEPASAFSGPERGVARETLAELKKRGFPDRHRQNLLLMHGPSLDKALALRERVLSGDCLLLLVGDRGPGKTQMATWWAAERHRSGKSVGYYRKTMDLIGEIKQTWADGGKSLGTENDVLNKYRRCGYLVLDEFHERGESDWEGRTLVNIIDHRYDAMLTTILIANLAPDEVKARVNPSIISRAEETGGLVLCDWPSYRKAA